MGTRLIAAAEQVYEDALRQAGAKFNTRARSRASATRQREVAAAVDARAPLRPLMAAVGLKEDELLRGVFDTFRKRAAQELQTYRNAVVATISDMAPDDRPPFDIVSNTDSAVEFLIAGLTAMVRSRLLDGEQATLAAARMIPRAPRPPTGGDILPGMPDPDELARAAARLVRRALDVHEGRADWQFPTTPDQMPNVTFLADEPKVEERLAVSVGVQPVWTWAHGFYGEPATVLDGHDILDGFTTNDPSSFDNAGDAELTNPEPWPGYEWYFPDDHDGCTCEWIVDTEVSDADLEALDENAIAPSGHQPIPDQAEMERMRADRAARREPAPVDRTALDDTFKFEWDKVPDRVDEAFGDPGIAMTDERAIGWADEQANPALAREYVDLARYWTNIQNDASRVGEMAFDIANGGAVPEGEVGQHAAQLARFLNNAPTIDQRIYRGMEWTDELPARGDTIALRPSSFSRDLDTAVSYADAQMGAGENVIVQVEGGATGLPIDALSSWSWGEREVITGGMFDVVRVEQLDEFVRLVVRQT